MNTVYKRTFNDNWELKGMLVDGAMLHCIPQERWSLAPSIGISGNLELSIRKNFVIAIWSVCTWHAHGYIEGHSSVCVCVCVCVCRYWQSSMTTDSRAGCQVLASLLVPATASGCSSDYTLQLSPTPVVGVSLFGPLVESPQLIDTLSVWVCSLKVTYRNWSKY